MMVVILHVVVSGHVVAEIFHAAVVCAHVVVEFVHVVVVVSCPVALEVSGHVAWVLVIEHAGKENAHVVD